MERDANQTKVSPSWILVLTRILHILYLSNYYYYYCHLFVFEFRNGEQSMRLTLLRYDWLRVVRISHLSGKWKRRTRRIRQKYYHRGFSFQREFYIFYICPTIIIIIIVIYSRLSFEMENNQCDSILLISTDRPFIGQVKKTMESDKSIIVVDSRFNANSTYFISVQF